MKRRNILIGLSGAALLLAGTGRRRAWAEGASGQQLAEAVEINADDRVLGDADAPVTIVEYASLTCPHCAHFHDDVFPALKENWIDTGKARLVFRHFPLDGLALRASALSECMEGVRFFGFLGILFETQTQWATADDPLAALQGLAKQAGMDEATSEACLQDETLLTKVLEERKVGSDDYGVDSTPSFLVNGEKMQGARTYEEFDAQLKEVLGEV
ncbi:MAG TPA: DsbA family protein [Kiloniellaceae bacterium]|nr:DsbA family protein [Kiloniellaceae bacterium]